MAGVTHSSLGLPRSSVARLLHTTLPACLIVSDTLEIFDSDSCTPARELVASVVLSSEITGGVCRSAVNCWAVVQ